MRNNEKKHKSDIKIVSVQGVNAIHENPIFSHLTMCETISNSIKNSLAGYFSLS